MKIILLGAPGVGKGTQAEKISHALGIPAVSTGLIIRHAIAQGTPTGVVAKQYIDEGQLVPDEVVIQLLLQRIADDDCKKGFILDGFPRTIRQAEELDNRDIEIDKVLSIELPDDKILERLSGRRECAACGRTYHVVYNKPRVEGICDSCGGELICREDDKPETIKSRLAVYHEQTEPLIQFYTQKGKLVVAHSQEEVADTTKEVFKALGVTS